MRFSIERGADVIVSAGGRRSISVGGGGAPPVQKNRRRRRRGPAWEAKNSFFLRFTKKCSILKIFLGTFLVIKALRFADDQCHREIKRRIATAASIWFEIWGSWIRVKKFRFLQANFRKISIFSGNFTKEYRVLQANFRKF